MIDIAIALALIYMMLAVLVSGVGELLATILQLRGKTLLRGVESLLSGATALQEGAPSLKDKLYAHPMIETLRDGDRLPSYIPASSFALAFADTLAQTYRTASPLFVGLPEAVSRLPEGDLKRALTVLVAQADGDAAKLQMLFEGHFDKIMERVSGWYKRQTQLVMFLIAAIVCVALNIDSVAITAQLVRDTELRNRLVANAEQLVKQVPPAAAAAPDVKQALDNVYGKLKEFKDMRLPIGWPRNQATGTDSLPSWALTVCGWIISALAATLGAPFWFDALSKLVSLRGSGTKPAQGSTPPADASAPSTTVVVQNTPAPPTTSDIGSSAAPAGPMNDFESINLNEVDIENIQRAIGMPAGDISGTLDANTRTMLRNWQQTHGRNATGTLDEPTVLAILHPTN